MADQVPGHEELRANELHQESLRRHPLKADEARQSEGDGHQDAQPSDHLHAYEPSKAEVDAHRRHDGQRGAKELPFIEAHENGLLVFADLLDNVGFHWKTSFLFYDELAFLQALLGV